MTKIRTEHLEQVDVVNHFRRNWPMYSQLIFSVPNGAIMGGKNKFGMMNKLKKEGWTKGVSDLIIAVPNSEYHGLLIEMKKSNGTIKDLKPEQASFLTSADSLGYRATWCAGASEAIELINAYMVEY